MNTINKKLVQSFIKNQPHKFNQLVRQQQNFILPYKQFAYQPQYSYFAKYINHYDCRKEIIMENKKQNEKIVRIRMPFYEKRYDQIKKNKKKFIFFLFILCVCQYNDYYKKFLLWHQYREPTRNKIKRWVFGEKNVVPETITEQNFGKIRISQESKDVLSEIYLNKDKELKLGITRKFLFKIYKEIGIIQKPEDKHVFYQVSGYGKKRNQRVASVNLHQFLKMFEDGLKKRRKQIAKSNSYIDRISNVFSSSDVYLTEEEFRSQFIQAFQNNFDKMQNWEKKEIDKLYKYRKMMPHQLKAKEDIIKEALAKKPLTQLSDLDVMVKEKGLMGLSIREKITILYRQKSLLLLYKNNYKEKIDLGSSGDHKLMKYSDELKKLTEQINDMDQKIQKLDLEFQELFPGRQLFTSYENDPQENL